MSSNESPSVQTPDVESLLEQVTLRGPSDHLDAAILGLATTNEVSTLAISNGGRFGWTAILATSAACMLVGVFLGSFFGPASHVLSGSKLAAVDSGSPDASLLTPISFSVQAFNLLHGHSQQEEFKNCDKCHQAAIKDAGLDKVFEGWFYGDARFFEVHPDGIGDCSKCHVDAAAERDLPVKGSAHEFAKLANCSDCHKVDADGFDGFKNDWISATNRSDG